ncbi:putative glycine cleavage system H protein [Desulfosarcina variabilis str. Montpellier]|uniref:glycine cleavage system protein H n=1 Tax=Desulfosarcina variabilis TaxID=2300 RepID=UPI003AFABB81
MNTIDKNHRRTVSPKKRVVGFNILEDRCIWMKAGVVNYRICDNAFDCNACTFNKAIRKAMNIDPAADSRTVAPKWVDYLIERYDGANRPCRHALTGRISAPKICSNNYECYHCAFDQMLDETELAVDLKTPACHEVAGYKIADDYYYHMGHSWARFEHGGRVRIGLDDFAACVFGHLNRVDLPPLGAEVQQDRVGWSFKRGDHQAGVLSPVTGTVLAVNHPAREHPQLVNEDPYGSGWLFIVEPDLPKRNLKRLFFGREAVQWIDQENRQLMHLMGPPYENLAATGGSVVRDIFGTIETLEWNALASRFLHTTRKNRT